MRPRRPWRTYALIVAAALAAAVLGGLIALTAAPAWYDPPRIRPEDRQAIRNQLVAAEQAFTEGLRAGKTFVYHIFQDDVNRWIAMRREIYPLIDELTPPEWEEPCVAFEDGLVRLAGRYRVGPLRLLLSVDVAVAFQKDRLRLALGALRCGACRLPSTLRPFGFDARINRSRGEVWPGSPALSGSLAGGLAVDARGWWKNGGIDYLLLNAVVTRGQIDLTVRPLGHQPPTARSVQSEPSARSSR